MVLVYRSHTVPWLHLSRQRPAAQCGIIGLQNRLSSSFETPPPPEFLVSVLANYRPQGGPWHVALTFCSIEGRNQHLIINFIHMSSDMKLRGDLILSLRARSTALEKLLEHLNCSIRGEVSRVQDRANFDICSSVLASNSHVVGSYTSCGTRAYNTQFQPVRIARVTQPRLHGKRPHLGIDQLPIITNQNCSVKKCQEMSKRFSQFCNHSSQLLLVPKLKMTLELQITIS